MKNMSININYLTNSLNPRNLRKSRSSRILNQSFLSTVISLESK